MALSTDVVKAKSLAIMAHNGQVDKAGDAYILHPCRVAENVSTPAEKVVAWLHDVVEDTGITLGTIRVMFGEDTAKAVDAITHRKGESYEDYVARAKENEVAKAVKIADLIDNSNLTRLKKIGEKDILRVMKYCRALAFMLDIDLGEETN